MRRREERKWSAANEETFHKQWALDARGLGGGEKIREKRRGLGIN